MAKVEINYDQVDPLIADMVEVYYRRNYSEMNGTVRLEEPIDTGLLRASTSIDPPKKIGPIWVLRFRAVAAHAEVVHQGHGVILPKKAKALRWVTKGGAVVFARRVRAVKARPFFYTAFRRLGFRNVRRLR